jgi:hypothetical protein
MTKVGLYAIGKATTLESNKSQRDYCVVAYWSFVPNPQLRCVI